MGHTITCDIGLDFKAIVQFAVLVAAVSAGSYKQWSKFSPYIAGLIAGVISLIFLLFGLLRGSFCALEEQSNVIFIIAFIFALFGFAYTLVRLNKSHKFQLKEHKYSDLNSTNCNIDRDEKVESLKLKLKMDVSDKITSVIVMIANLVFMYVSAFYTILGKVDCSFTSNMFSCCCGNCICMLLIALLFPITIGCCLRRRRVNGYISLVLSALALFLLIPLANVGYVNFPEIKITISFSFTLASVVFGGLSQTYELDTTPSAISLAISAAIPLVAINIV